MTKCYDSKGNLLYEHPDYKVLIEDDLFRMLSDRDRALEFGKFLSEANPRKNIIIKEEDRQIGLFYKY